MEITKKTVTLAKKIYTIRFFRYCLAGGIAGLTDLTIFYTANELVHLYYLYAIFISFTIAAMVNYILQRRLTFKNKYTKKHKQIAVFVVIQLIGLILNAGFTVLLVEFAGIWPTFARFIAIFIVLAYNYTANKLITFKLMQ